MTRRHTPENRPRVQKPLVHVIGPQVVSSQAPLSQALLEVLHGSFSPPSQEPWEARTVVLTLLVRKQLQRGYQLAASSFLQQTLCLRSESCVRSHSGSNANSNNCNKLHEMTYPCYYYPPAARPCVRPLTCIISFSLHNNTGRQVLLLYTLESC